MYQEKLQEKKIIRCPACKRKLRVPTTANSLKIKCRYADCLHIFTFHSHSFFRRKLNWFLIKIKLHPILSGLIITAWILLEWSTYNLGTLSLMGSLYITALCIGLWSLGNWIIESFKEKETKWYYRKWFVLLMLIFIPPLGITLLWAGSNFKKANKIVFTFVFSLWFIWSAVTRTTEKYRFLPEEAIISLFKSPKENIYIKAASDLVINNFQDLFLSNHLPLTTDNLTIPQIVQKCGDSIVLVKSVDKDGQEIGIGSGFVVTKEGSIITNYHVIESAYNVSVEFPNGEVYTNLTYVVGNPYQDIAVLNIESKGEQFSPLILGDSENIQVGEQVIAIGNPLGWRNSLSDGLVSGIRQVDDLILLQITAPISPGSSGGALFNIKGEVIGITTIASLWGAQNLNFAIPINSLKSFIKDWSNK